MQTLSVPTTDATSQTEVTSSVDASVQWSAPEVPVEDRLLCAAADAIDTSIGFEDKKVSRPELKARAQYLMANGCKTGQIQTMADAHWDKIDNIRPGDTLLRRCGASWYMHGDNGRSYATEDSKLKVTSIGSRGYVQGRCDKKHEYGRVPVAEFLFDIEHQA